MSNPSDNKTSRAGRSSLQTTGHRAFLPTPLRPHPRFNISGWAGERLRDDKRWQFSALPKGNAHLACIQHVADT